MTEEKQVAVPGDEVSLSKPLAPIVDPEAAKRAMEAYQKLCAAILIPWEERKVAKGVIKQESDYQRIKVKDRDPETGKDEYVFRDFPKKSAWRKLGKFYNVSTEILGKERINREDGSFVWHYTVKAIAPNGQFTSGEGSCDSKEIAKERRREHDTKSTAHTRAKNRAISDLIGFGQISAEELEPPKQVESTVVEKKPVQISLGDKVNLNVIEYNLKAYSIPSDDVDVWEDTDCFMVAPTRELTEQENYNLTTCLNTLGAVWDEKGPRGAWVIKKEGSE
ncbi:hypothetical protein ES702_03848 [subsurface metagenome]